MAHGFSVGLVRVIINKTRLAYSIDGNLAEIN